MEPWRSRDIYGRRGGGDLGLGDRWRLSFFYFYFIIMRFGVWFLMIPLPPTIYCSTKDRFCGGFFFSPHVDLCMYVAYNQYGLLSFNAKS